MVKTLEQRMELYQRAMGLRREKRWGDYRISRELGINRHVVNNWIYGGRNPCGGLNLPDLNPSAELSYVLGVCYGDGSLVKRGYKYEIRLEVKDKDFVLEFDKCLSKILRRENPYPIYQFRKGIYTVLASNRVLYEFLKKTLEEHKPIIEKVPPPFLRGFFDSEGGVHIPHRQHRHMEARVYAANTDLSLLRYIRELLARFSITSNISIAHRKGKVSSGLIRCNATKDCYQLQFSRRNDVMTFYKEIGFSIRRKQERLEKFAYKVGEHKANVKLDRLALQPKLEEQLEATVKQVGR